ncbi:MAG: hypothetical protein H6811_12045 [Phycisphaeraceae bacterium]|nr:hypothetical protein [Phycisphaeraceae bacterium]
MNESRHPTEPLPLHVAARYLRVPARWLREEIEAGRLPALRAGRSILVHVPTVSAALAERAKAERAEGGAE